MDKVPPDVLESLDAVEKGLSRYQNLVTLFGVGILTLIGWLLREVANGLKSTPDLQWQITDHTAVEGNEDVTFSVQVTNIGTATAKDIQYTWTPLSRCDLPPVPSGFFLRKDESRSFALSMPGSEVIRIGLFGRDTDSLGLIDLHYYAGWHRWRKTSRAIYVDKHPQSPVRLGPIPPRTLGEAITPLGHWQRWWGQLRRVRETSQHLQQSRDFLKWRSLEVNLIFPKEGFVELGDQLWKRDWHWSHETLGSGGHTVVARKTYPPSTSRTYRAFADTPLDAITLVLRRAIEEDEQQGHRAALS